MPPKERDVTAGRPTPPKPAEEAPKMQTTQVEDTSAMTEAEKEKVVKEGTAAEFVAVTSIKTVNSEGEVVYTEPGGLVEGFSAAEMVALHEAGSIRQK